MPANPEMATFLLFLPCILEINPRPQAKMFTEENLINESRLTRALKKGPPASSVDPFSG